MSDHNLTLVARKLSKIRYRNMEWKQNMFQLFQRKSGEINKLQRIKGNNISYKVCGLTVYYMSIIMSIT